MERKAYHDVMPKTPYYRTDGSGRDLYIAYDNGGTFQPMMKIHSHRKPCSRPSSASSSSQKSLHYISNGTGRDSYIRINDGGFHSSSGPQFYLKSFQKDLRNYQPIKYNNDLFTWTQSSWQTSKSRLFNQTSHSKVQACVARLYRPK